MTSGSNLTQKIIIWLAMAIGMIFAAILAGTATQALTAPNCYIALAFYAVLEVIVIVVASLFPAEIQRLLPFPTRHDFNFPRFVYFALSSCIFVVVALVCVDAFARGTAQPGGPGVPSSPEDFPREIANPIVITCTMFYRFLLYFLIGRLSRRTWPDVRMPIRPPSPPENNG